MAPGRRTLGADGTGAEETMQVAEGIEWVDGVRWSNVYLVRTDDGLLLVDTGTGLGRTTRRILEAVEALGRRPRDVHDIVLTHYDADHVGGLARLAELTGARVAIHELDAPVVMKKQPPLGRMLLVRILYRWLQRPVVPDRLLVDGDVVGGLRVVHVPGHTAGSIALVRDDGAVFSGDTLLADKHGNVLPPDPRLAEDRDLVAASAERIRALDPRPLLPGHGAPSSASTMAAGGGAAVDRRARRRMRAFDRFLPPAVLVERYGAEATVMRREMHEEYRRLLPGVPHLGRDGSSDRHALGYAPMALAIYRVVLRHGGDVEDAGRLLRACARALYRRLPAMLHPVLRWYLFSGLRQRRMAKAARSSQARRYPADWVFEMVAGDGRTFDFGRDITECGIVKYLHAQGADELTPYLCDWDYVMAETLGIQLRRTKTLAWGCDRCDFRMARHGTTAAPWPPEFVERSCGQVHEGGERTVRAG